MRKILIVDDEAPVTHILASKLKQAGFEAHVAADGEEGLSKALQVKPDLIISDFQMPLMSGLEMCAKLKAEPATAAVPVVLLTARGHRVNAEELALTNIRLVTPKPFSARDLVAKVTEMLRGKGGEGAAAA